MKFYRSLCVRRLPAPWEMANAFPDSGRRLFKKTLTSFISVQYHGLFQVSCCQKAWPYNREYHHVIRRSWGVLQRERGGKDIHYSPTPAHPLFLHLFSFTNFDILTQDTTWYNERFTNSDYPQCWFTSPYSLSLPPLPATPLPYIIYK